MLPALEPVLRDLAMMGVQDQVQRFLRLTQQAADLQVRGADLRACVPLRA